MTPAGSVHLAAYRAHSLAEYRADPLAEYRVEYEAVLTQARRTVADYPPLLRDLAQPLLPGWGESSFSRIVALLPYWVADLLDQAAPPEDGPRPSRPEETEALALANLLGWWSHLIQDGLLDREPEHVELLPLSAALHASAVHLLAYLLPDHTSFWEAFERLSLATSEACAWEQQSRLDTLELAGAGAQDQGRIADRSSLLQLAVEAQFALRGIDREHPLRAALAGMLRHYALARQIGDDRSDWAQDLRNGRLNYVSSRLARRMMETGAIASFVELDAERMMGYYLADDELFANIQQEAMEACQQAAECIAPYRSRPLDSLVSELALELEKGFRDTLERRRGLQAVFALERRNSRHGL